jgi:hypothetical protein
LWGSPTVIDNRGPDAYGLFIDPAAHYEGLRWPNFESARPA